MVSVVRVLDLAAEISANGAHNSSQQWLEKHMPTNLFRYHLAASPHELFILWESLASYSLSAAKQ